MTEKESATISLIAVIAVTAWMLAAGAAWGSYENRKRLDKLEGK